MKVKRISVENLKSIEAYQADFNWCSAIITGWNNQWKSTFLKSFVDRVRWSKNANIIKEWEKAWYCEYELTDWSKFIRVVWEDEKITFITAWWVEIKKGVIKDIAWKLFWSWFDIDEFLNSHPKQQKEKLQKLIWIDISELENEYKNAYEDRREKNSSLKSFESICEDIKIYDDIQEVNIDEINTKISEAECNNNNIMHVNRWLEEKHKLIDDINKTIEDLKLQKEKVSEDIEKWTKYLKDNKKIDTTKLKEERDAAMENNKKFQENISAKKKIKSLNEAKEAYANADKLVKEIEEKKLKIIKEAKIPEWFEFTDEWLKYNWFDLDKKQLSSSSIYIASLKLASMWLWTIETLSFDASYLDKKSLSEIEKWANDNWLQLLIERPDFDWGWLKYEIIS